MGVLGDRRGIVVADLGRQRGDQHQRPVHQLGDPLFVRLGAVEHPLGEALHPGRQQVDRADHVRADHGLEHVQLHMALEAADRHRDVIAHHLGGDHGQALALGWVDLTRHDARSGLHRRKIDLPQACPRPGR